MSVENYGTFSNHESDYREMIAGPFGTTIGLEGCRLTEPESPLLDREDVYGNEYWKSKNVTSVKPDTSNFSEQLKSCLSFAHNFLTLDNQGITVPDFEAGVAKVDGETLPYFLMSTVQGQRVNEGEFNDGIYNQVEKINAKGRELGKNKDVLYTEPFTCENFVVSNQRINEGEVFVTCPGTYTEEYFKNQISDSAMDLSIEEISEMEKESYWV